MSTLLHLSVLMHLTRCADYQCNQIDCNQQYVFNEPTPDTSFYCNAAGACNNLAIYYAASSALNIFCTGQDSCNGTNVFCGNWPPITNITNGIQCSITCQGTGSPSCKNVLFSCNAQSGEVDECWMGSIQSSYNMQSSTMECNIGNENQNNCEMSCLSYTDTGCSQNKLLCHTDSNCYCGEGNCDNGVTIYNDITYEPTINAPITETPTSSPSTKTPTNQPTSTPTTKIPTTAIPTTAIPTTTIPTIAPTNQPTLTPTTAIPTTSMPTTSTPSSNIPTLSPTNNPTKYPTTTDILTTAEPTQFPMSSEPTTTKPTHGADGNVEDVETTMDDQDEHKENNVDGDDGLMEDEMLLIIGGCIAFVIIICCIVVISYCRRPSKTEMAKVISEDLTTPIGTIEMDHFPSIPQPHVTRIDTMDKNNDDNMNAMYMKPNTVAPTTKGGDGLDDNIITPENFDNDENDINKNTEILDGEDALKETDDEMDEMYIVGGNNEPTKTTTGF